MRTLSATLTTAQKQAASSPYLEVKVEDKVFGVTRLAWTRLYTGSEPLGYHALALPGDGSLNRARIDPADNTLYRQRVVSPAPGSDFSVWTSVATVAPSTWCAMAARNYNVVLFWIDNVDNTKINYQASSNWGLSWGGTESIQTAAPVTYLAAAYDSSMNLTLFYNAGAAIKAVTRTSGNWGSPVSWTNSMSSLTGLAAVKDSSGNLYSLLVSGNNSANTKKGLYSCTYDQPQGSWSALQTIIEAESDSSISYKAPFLFQPDQFRCSFVEKFTGNNPYTYPFLSYTAPGSTFTECLWVLPSPYSYTSDYGLALSFSGSYAWMTSPDGVWQAPLSPALLDVSSDVLSLAIDTDEAGGRALVELRNDSGQYSSFARLGQQLTINLGYRTTQGAEVSTGLAFQIQSCQHICAGGKATALLMGWDPGIYGGVIKVRSQLSWTAGQKSIANILKILLSKLGVELEVISQSSLAQSYQPPLTLHPNQTIATGIRRLLEKCPDVLVYRGSKALLRNPLASDASEYAYGTDHVIIEGRYSQELQETNWAQAFNALELSQSFSWAEVEKANGRLQQVQDISLSLSETQARANAEIRESEIRSPLSAIIVPLNCGQELYDVVTITDPRAGLSAQKRRVLGLRHTFACSPGIYHLRLGLGDA